MSLFETRKQRLVVPVATVVGTSAVNVVSTPCHGVLLKAMCPGQTIYIGAQSTLTSANGYPLGDGQELELAVKNVNQIWAIGSAAALSLRALPYFFD